MTYPVSPLASTKRYYAQSAHSITSLRCPFTQANTVAQANGLVMTASELLLTPQQAGTPFI